MFDVKLMTKTESGEYISKVVYANMTEEDARKVAQRMNRLNILAAKNLGKAFNFVFSAVKHG